MRQLLARWVPAPRVMHPYPREHFTPVIPKVEAVCVSRARTDLCERTDLCARTDLCGTAGGDLHPYRDSQTLSSEKLFLGAVVMARD